MKYCKARGSLVNGSKSRCEGDLEFFKAFGNCLTIRKFSSSENIIRNDVRSNMRISSMKKLFAFMCLFFSLSFAVSISPAYADSDMNLTLTNFPEALASKLSISVFAGGLLASMVLTLAFMLPVAIWSKTLYPPIFAGLICLGLCVVFQWLDYWFLLIDALVVALLFGPKISGKTEE